MTEQYIAVHVSKARSILARKSVSAGYVKLSDCNRADVPKLISLLNLGVQAEMQQELDNAEATAETRLDPMRKRTM